MISLDASVVASSDQVSCEVEGEAIILSMRTSEYFGLNTVGKKIWDLIQQPTSVRSVRDRLLEEYPEVEPDQCTADLLELLEELRRCDLVDLLEPTPVRGGTGVRADAAAEASRA